MRTVRLATVGAMALTLCSASSQALAAEMAFEGEAMTPSSEHVRVVDDYRATNDKALVFFNNDRASRSFSSTTDLARILLRLRGDQCGDPPQPRVAVELDDPSKRVWAAPIGSSDSYVLYEAFVDIPAGEHTLHVHMTNDYSQPGGLLRRACSRNLYLDTVTLKDMPSLFHPDSYRNAPLPANTPIDPLSDHFRNALISYLDGLDDSDPYARGVNTTSWSTPVYVVPAQQRRVQVAVDTPLLSTLRGYDVGELAEQWQRVPLPRGAQPADAGGSRDNHLVVYQPETDTLWEFFKFRYDALTGQPKAVYGGRMTEVSRNPGHFTGPDDEPAGPGSAYGATATSIPLLVGLQSIDEVLDGSIDHVVAFNMPNVAEDFCRWPAQRTDGPDDESELPPDVPPLPKGLRFRLPASLDLDAYALTPYGRMVAEAVQRHGMVLTDAGSNFAFEAEDPTPLGGDPYEPVLGPSGERWGESGVLRNFPWHQLETLDETFPRPGRCTLDPPGV